MTEDEETKDTSDLVEANDADGQEYGGFELKETFCLFLYLCQIYP